MQAIAAFLRVLNALENIRSSINVAERGRSMTTGDDKRDLAHLALSETIDALQVLSEGALAKSTEPGILSARIRLLGARQVLETANRLQMPNALDGLLTAAVSNLRAARAELADPATLPASFSK